MNSDRAGSVEIVSSVASRPSAAQKFSMEALGALPSASAGWPAFADRSFHAGDEPVELFATAGNGVHSGTRSDWAEALDSVCLDGDADDAAIPNSSGDAFLHGAT